MDRSLLVREISEKSGVNFRLCIILRGVILSPRVSVITYSKSWPLILSLINGLD